MPNEPVQTQLQLGEACPIHGYDRRRNAGIPVGAWNSHGAELEERYRDTVYECDANNRDGSRCAWAWSVQVGLFVPAGKNLTGMSKATLYHEKRYRPQKWERRFSRRNSEQAAAQRQKNGSPRFTHACETTATAEHR